MPSRTVDSPPDILERFERLQAECAADRRRIATLENEVADLKIGFRAKALRRRDRKLLAPLLPAVGGVFGSEAILADEITESQAAAVRLVRGTLSTRQIGWLFRRAEGVPIDGYVIERAGKEGHAILWRVLKVSEFFERRNSAIPLPGAAQSPKLDA